ncbi:DUF1266 domain-containing protein [Streptomyces paludis]|uniref:DUF1266 domain-containing protein n=1 Tax=Streptomyces paludis TaxID=2282738 RepID=A0A345HUM5_9ACTN|nr:DUF1266 domain-containing protein [Streptomyces paludis]AXG80399.1 DUF1266 domain-containing protein [Streptomyces paludis]
MTTGTGTGTGTGADTGTGAAADTAATTAGASPPTETERLLAEAVARGDDEGVLDILARGRLYVLVARLHADTPGYVPPLATLRDPLTGRRCVSVLTAGMLPPWHPEWVFRATTLTALARSWPYDERRLGVNLGTPYAATVDARTARRKAWPAAEERTGGVRRGRLLTDGTGPLYGPLAHGLALGAHLAVHNSLVWNRLGAAYIDYPTDISWLRSPWRVTHRAEYRQKLDSLLAGQLVGRAAESVLATRRTLARRLDRTPSLAEWSAGVTRSADRLDGSRADLTEAEALLRVVVAYEDRLRADGALAPDGRIDTLAAFDLGRAVNVVRMALGARYCDPAEAERAVLRIGEAARQAYGSWPEFSLGYGLARLIGFHDDEAGDPDAARLTYEETLAQHRVLTRDPASPYRNIPW